jgi:putative glutamine amidotransferase
VARAGDGVVEAVEMTDRAFFLGVQWHPERILERPGQRRLFEAFVSACR